MMAKAQYSEVEAACEVGVCVEQLRALIQLHIVRNDEELGSVPVAAFSSSDVLMLRLLAASSASLVNA